jgi:3-dehydroquinate dehydratase-2
MLGKREPDHYGNLSLEEINHRLTDLAATLELEPRFFQSNVEGTLIDSLQESAGWASGGIVTPGGYSHTSVAIRDAIAAIKLPVIEVHLPIFSPAMNSAHLTDLSRLRAPSPAWGGVPKPPL